jgi:hypothetical protein
MDNKQIGTAAHRAAMDMRPAIQELSREANELWQCTGDNPLEVDECYFANFVARLERAQVRSLVDLVAADNVLELMYSRRLRGIAPYTRLLAKAKAFIKQYPQLLEMGWVHCQGCIAELIEEMKLDMSDAQTVLARYRL